MTTATANSLLMVSTLCATLLLLSEVQEMRWPVMLGSNDLLLVLSGTSVAIKSYCGNTFKRDFMVI